MFSDIYYGNSLREWLISLTIVLAAVLLNKLIVLLNVHVLIKLTDKTKNRMDDVLFRMLQAPVLLGVMLLAIWIAANRLTFTPNVLAFISKAYQFLIVLNATWFLVRFANALIEEYLEPKAQDHASKYIDNTLMPIVRRGILSLIWAVGVMMALRNVGVDVGALIAGLGIGGLAFALAGQHTVKNIFGGITIFTDRPYRIGDRIRVDGFEGFIEDIGIRSTRLRTLEKRLITIPNYKVVEASIENISEEPMHKVQMHIGLTYHTTVEQMEQAIAILKSIPKSIKEIDSKELVAVFDNFASQSLDIKFVYWIKKSGDVIETPSKVNFEILNRFREAGLHFANQTTTEQLSADMTTK